MLSKFKNRYLVFPLDIGFMVASYFLANLIRYESLDFLEFIPNFWVSLCVVVLARAAVFLFSGIYRSLWAYASLHDLLEIIKTTFLSSLASTTALLFYNRFSQNSRMVPILDTLILLSFLCARSFSWRIFRDGLLRKALTSQGKPTLLIGAGKMGASFLADIQKHSETNFHPVGFLDDDFSKSGAYIQGIPILGKVNELKRIILEYSITDVILTIANPDGKLVGYLREVCLESNVNFKILPPIGSLLSEKIDKRKLREVQVEDLLGRPVVDLDLESIKSYLKNKVILITGAGGSIGSELCRQVIEFHPKTLILLDVAETPLYEIDYELRKYHEEKAIEFIPIICDVKSLARLSYIFEKFSPQVVFHSAAYKHVPMMEIHPTEAILNNVMGTKNLADISRLTGVERFVLISTDKAVNPVNIMGASKRVSELYLQHISLNSRTKFVTVRFGNVLGSNGSVIPRFREQIKEGGPVTVTHPEIIRYFMTIPEASQLVLQAGSMGNHGEIFILDMGEPIKILKLAEDMIRLSGLVPYQDIKIEFTGLRPGEKLFEELLLDLEGIKPTHHPKIKIAAPLENYNVLLFQNKLNQLLSFAKANKELELPVLLKELVPEYQIHEDYILEVAKVQ